MILPAYIEPTIKMQEINYVSEFWISKIDQSR